MDGPPDDQQPERTPPDRTRADHRPPGPGSAGRPVASPLAPRRRPRGLRPPWVALPALAWDAGAPHSTSWWRRTGAGLADARDRWREEGWRGLTVRERCVLALLGVLTAVVVAAATTGVHRPRTPSALPVADAAHRPFAAGAIIPAAQAQIRLFADDADLRTRAVADLVPVERSTEFDRAMTAAVGSLRRTFGLPPTPVPRSAAPGPSTGGGAASAALDAPAPDRVRVQPLWYRLGLAQDNVVHVDLYQRLVVPGHAAQFTTSGWEMRWTDRGWKVWAFDGMSPAQAPDQEESGWAALPGASPRPR
ncbi:MAG: hypothetical protein ACTHOD_16405 [Motilibacteraceae bacterium]